MSLASNSFERATVSSGRPPSSLRTRVNVLPFTPPDLLTCLKRSSMPAPYARPWFASSPDIGPTWPTTTFAANAAAPAAIATHAKSAREIAFFMHETLGATGCGGEWGKHVPRDSCPICPRMSTSTHEIESRYAWWRLAASLALMTIGGGGMYSITVVLPRIQQDFGVDRGAASLPYTLTMIGFGVGGVMMGRLADRFSVGVPVSVGAVGLGSGFIASGLAPNLLMFDITQGLV